MERLYGHYCLTSYLQMDVDCIVYQENIMPEVRHFCPDPNFPWNKADTGKPENPTTRMHPKMNILNYKDTHFNLVIEKESMIAPSGTFSFQRNLADKPTPIKTTNQKLPSLTESDKIHNTDYDVLAIKIKSLEEALTKSETENQLLKKQVSNMHNNEGNRSNNVEVMKMCHECDILFENDDMLHNHNKLSHYQFSHNCQDCGKGFNQKSNMVEHRKSHNRKGDNKIQCNMCQIYFQTEAQLINHNNKQHPQDIQNTDDEDIPLKEAKQFNCMECDHQTTNEHMLTKHMKLAHNTHKPMVEFKCHSCAQEFWGMWNLRNHRQDAHGKSKVKCRYKADNSCKYGANDGEQCWYDHSEGTSIQNRKEKTDKNKCKACEEMFSSKSQLLTHRKEEHPEIVPLCKSIKENTGCEYGDKCRFRHKELSSHMPSIHKNPGTANHLGNDVTQVFWKTQNIIKPPNHHHQSPHHQAVQSQ